MSDKRRTVARWSTADIQPAEHGGFVAYGDYLTLAKELADAKAELAEYAKTVAHMRDGARLQDSATAAVMERAEKAEAELAACREDAERYRWLRELPNADAMNVKFCGCDLDTVIDAARKEGA